jgi:hypothetical protein
METKMPDSLPPNTTPVHDPASVDTFERQLVQNGWSPEDAKARADQFRPVVHASNLPSKSAAPFSADGTGVSPDQVEKAVAGQIKYRGELAAKAGDTSLSASERAQAETGLKQVDEVLKRYGYDPVNPPVDTRTEAERQFDHAGLHASADVNQYDLQGVYSRPDLEGTDVAAIDATMRSSLVELGVPKALGKVVAEAILDGAKTWQSLRTDADRVEHNVNHQRVVSRALGMPYDKAIEAVKPLIAKLSESNKQWLAQSGALENPAVIVHLHRGIQLASARGKLGGQS